MRDNGSQERRIRLGFTMTIKNILRNVKTIFKKFLENFGSKLRKIFQKCLEDREMAPYRTHPKVLGLSSRYIR